MSRLFEGFYWVGEVTCSCVPPDLLHLKKILLNINEVLNLFCTFASETNKNKL